MFSLGEFSTGNVSLNSVEMGGVLFGGVSSGGRSQTVELVLRLPDGISPDGVQAVFPVLKYNKRFIFTYTADDGPVGAYGKVLQAVNGKWVDDEKFFHFGQRRTTGYVPDRTLGYTDGCGTEHRLPIGVAIWPNCGNVNNPNFMDGNPSMPSAYPYLTWKSVPPILDFGGELYFHNMNQDKWDKNDPVEIVKGLREDQAKVLEKTGRGVKVMMEPDGNHAYLTAGGMYDAIKMMWAQTQPAVDLYPNGDPDYHKAVGMRKVYLDNNVNEMAWIKGIHDSENPKWCHLFTHTPAQNIIDLLTELNNTYGKDGDDSVWMATVDEVYEYWFVRKHTVIRKEVDGRTVRFILSIPTEPHFYHGDLCLNVEGIGSLEGVTVEVNDAVFGLAYAIDKGTLLVNVSYDEQMRTRAEKYTALFENSGEEEDMADAMYFASLLCDGLAAPYLERIEAVVKEDLGRMAILSFTGNNNPAYEVHEGNTINVVNVLIASGWAPAIIKDTSGKEFGSIERDKASYPADSGVKGFISSVVYQPVLSGDTGAYPDKYIQSYYGAIDSNFIGNQSLLIFNLPNGVYDVRLLVSSGEPANVPVDKYGDMFYQCNDGTPVNLSFNQVNNVEQFVEIDGVGVQDGKLRLRMYNTSGGYNARPGFNLMEIVRKG